MSRLWLTMFAFFSALLIVTHTTTPVVAQGPRCISVGGPFPDSCDCTKGRVLLNGQPLDNVNVTLTCKNGVQVDRVRPNETGEGPTEEYETDHFPFSGRVISHTSRMLSDENDLQPIDLIVPDAVWKRHASEEHTRTLTIVNNRLWAGGDARMQTINLTNNTVTTYPTSEIDEVGHDAAGVYEFANGSTTHHNVPLGSPIRAIAAGNDELLITNNTQLIVRGADERWYVPILPNINEILSPFVGLFILCTFWLYGNGQSARASMLTGPDLVIESVTITPENPDVGDPVDIQVVVRNIGDAVSGGIRLHLYVDPTEQPPAESTPHTATTFFGLGLAPNGMFTFSRTDETFAVAGIHPIYAWVDRDNRVNEGDETNNRSGPHNLQVGSVAGDEFEPDDICENSTPLVVNGETQVHNLHPVGDSDWIQFEAQSGVRYELNVDAIGADVDVSVDILSDCYRSSGGFAQTFTALTNGTHYARIYHNQSDYGDDTTYQVSIEATTNCNAHYEPNNSCHYAGLIYANEGPQIHDFCQEADSDWVKLNIEAGYDYTIVAEGLGALADPQIEVRTECSGTLPLRSTSVLTFSAPYSGPAYVRLFNHNASAYGQSTSYRLEVSGNDGCSADIYEQDNTPTTATPLTVDATPQTHNVCPANDPDWVEFSAAANTIYTIETLNLGASSDTVLCLYDSNNNKIDCDDDSGAGLASKVEFVPPQSGVYRVRVQDNNEDMAGEHSRYDIQVRSSRCTLDAFEPDNSQATAQSIMVNGAATQHTFCVLADHDWHVFTTNGGPHVIETIDLGIESDTVLRLYNANEELLHENNNVYGGVASQIEATLDAGTYFIELFHYDPSRYGNGTQYALQVRTGQATPPPPTPTPSPTPSPTPTPPESETQTLIIVNEQRMADRFGTDAVADMMTQLGTLAEHERVKGEILRIENNDTVANAYAAWDGTTDETNVEKANGAAIAIRNLIQLYAAEHINLRYLVLVGDDNSIPFYRLPDEDETSYPERVYTTEVGGEHPTAFALASNYYLSDDIYGDINPTGEQHVFIPDLATGRLVETPEEIGAFVATYLETPSVSAENALVTGYDFVQDSAQESCNIWEGTAIANLNCELTHNDWSINQYRTYQLLADPPYAIRSINGHATHYAEGSADERHLLATELLSSHLGNGVVYTPGCHAGLNVPETNLSSNPNNNYALDLPQTYLKLGYNYIGNTGYGWGSYLGIGLSESLAYIYTQQLVDPDVLDVGTAFMRTKQAYYAQTPSFGSLETKVLQQWTFYGLPMFQVDTGSTRRAAPNEFPSAEFDGNFAFSIGPTVFSGQLDLTQSLSQQVEISGTYYALDGHVQNTVGEAMQPLFFADVTQTGTRRAEQETLRGVVFNGGDFTTISEFDPFVSVPTNEYLSDVSEPVLEKEGWQPALPVSIVGGDGKDEFRAVLGQYSAETKTQRLYNNVAVTLYYSSDSDLLPPTINHISGLYNANDEQVHITVGATDESSIHTVVIAYLENGTWQSERLSLDHAGQMWTGSISGSTDTRYIVQAVDESGNVSAETNKGHYYAAVDLCSADPDRCASFPPSSIRLQSNQTHAPSQFELIWLPLLLLMLTLVLVRVENRSESI